MNLILSSALIRKISLSAMLLLALPCAYAQFSYLRSIPANAPAAVMKPTDAYNVISLNNKQYRLSVGALVFDRRNISILRGMFPDEAKVRYLIAPNGEITKVWILTAEEIQNISNTGAYPTYSSPQ